MQPEKTKGKQQKPEIKQQKQQNKEENQQNVPEQVSPSVNQVSAHQEQSANNQEDWESFGEENEAIVDINLPEMIQLANQNLQSNEQQSSEEQMEDQSKQQQKQQEYTLGCEHYLRNCEVEAPCCKIYYVCKLCHDEKYQGPKANFCRVERMEFDKVEHIRCLLCKKVQQPSLKCTNPQCQITFGKYACLKCKLYENRSTKVNDIFHCDECKMCRRGHQEDFFHCQKCGYCRAISQKNRHQCKEDIALSKCPICMQVLKFSTKYYISLPCGHLIHQDCLRDYRDINCPVCGMATQKFSKAQNDRMDLLIQQTKGNLPKQVLQKKVDILCNQCLHKSYQQPFHFLGIKCLGCGTYNTKMI